MMFFGGELIVYDATTFISRSFPDSSLVLGNQRLLYCCFMQTAYSPWLAVGFLALLSRLGDKLEVEFKPEKHDTINYHLYFFPPISLWFCLLPCRQNRFSGVSMQGENIIRKNITLIIGTGLTVARNFIQS